MTERNPAAGAPPALRREVGLIGVVTFGAGTAIGVSIFTVLQPAAQIGCWSRSAAHPSTIC